MPPRKNRPLATRDGTPKWPRSSGTPELGADSIASTEAQNEFGAVMERATHGHDVVITRHGVPRAVLVSIDRYRELTSAEAAALDALTAEFDALFERMQTPEWRAGMDRALKATPDFMGRAAVAEAKRSRERKR